MNEEFNEKDHVDHVTHDQEQEETVEHRHTEEPTQSKRPSFRNSETRN